MNRFGGKDPQNEVPIIRMVYDQVTRRMYEAGFRDGDLIELRLVKRITEGVPANLTEDVNLRRKRMYGDGIAEFTEEQVLENLVRK